MGMGKWEGWRIVGGGNGYKSINSVAIEWQWLCSSSGIERTKRGLLLAAFFDDDFGSLVPKDILESMTSSPSCASSSSCCWSWCRTWYRGRRRPLSAQPSVESYNLGIKPAQKKRWWDTIPQLFQIAPLLELDGFWIMSLEVMWAVWCFFFSLFGLEIYCRKSNKEGNGLLQD